MKKVLLTTVLSLSLLIACGKKEADKEVVLDNDFKVDLSDMDFDFSKPQEQDYKSEMQRDSIISEFSQDVAAMDVDDFSDEESKVVTFLVSFSSETKTITSSIIATPEQIDLTTWKDIAVCPDAECLTSKMGEIIKDDSSADFAIKRDVNNRDINLYYKMK